jgi:hypothetical protein
MRVAGDGQPAALTSITTTTTQMAARVNPSGAA